MAEREATMDEDGNRTMAPERGTLPFLGREEKRDRPRKGDLVVDLSGMKSLDVANLALLLTAQRSAQEEDRAVWLAGVPIQVWAHLHRIGLGRFFKPFPEAGATLS